MHIPYGALVFLNLLLAEVVEYFLWETARRVPDDRPSHLAQAGQQSTQVERSVRPRHYCQQSGSTHAVLGTRSGLSNDDNNNNGAAGYYFKP